jgi:hypothetical protein
LSVKPKGIGILKIALLHKPDIKFFQPDFFSPYFYNFFYRALPRSTRIDYTILQRETADVDELNQYDVVILFALSDKLGYIPIPDGCKAVVIANAYDSQYIDSQYIARARECGVWGFFYHHCPQWFYRFAPKEWKYCQVQMVLEPDDYRKCVPWDKRNKNRVLVTGTIGHKEYYPLRRTLAGHSDGIIKYLPISDAFTRERYPLLLNQFRAHVAACSVTTVNKYLQSMAAGCLTFACCNGVNGWENLGLSDGANCIAVNQDNAVERIRAYLADVDNPEYAEIAAEGRRHVMENLNNDVMVDRLINWIEREL